ncbi:hypothetical protein ACH36K_08870 [Clostridium sp. MB05]
MIKFKIQKGKNEEPIFKIRIKDKELVNYPFLKRAIIEAKEIKGRYNYQVPLRYFVPLVNNINKESLCIDKDSKLEFFEFWDDFEEKYYASLTATPKFMKLWREEKCPNIFKIKIDMENLTLSKEIAFKKINIRFGEI